MDVVYVVRPGERNDELRYSLRSLVNVPHDRVFVAGFRPSWVAGVECIPTEQDADKQVNARRNLEAALADPRVSSPFLLFNDDFFVMWPHDDGIPALHRGPLDAVIELYHPLRHSAYTVSMVATRDLLHDLGMEAPLSYELHVPMSIEKPAMESVLALGRDIYGFHLRTAYGNVANVGGDELGDVKVYSNRDRGWRDWPLVSTNDATFRRHPVGRHIRATFPKPGPYERAP